MKSAEKARSNGLYRHIRTSKEIIRNLLNDSAKKKLTQILAKAVIMVVNRNTVYIRSVYYAFAAG